MHYQNNAAIDLSKLRLPTIDEIDKSLAEDSLKEFIKQAWHVVEPSTTYIHGWHIDAICEHLEAVSNGEIKRLLICIPPRCMKSLCVSVFWPCWQWIKKPATRFLFASYAHSVSIRDNVKCRRIIQSNWYQDNWMENYKFTSDQNEKLRYENDKTGYRLATSVDGVATAEGGDFLIVDDPHNVKESLSPVKLGNVITWWDESMQTRLNDAKTGAIVIIMQRIHERDLAGHVLEQGNYDMLCLPARYEGNRCNTSLGYIDRRAQDGELLWPERFGEKEIADLEKSMGIYAAAGQLQQRPSPRGGGMFKVERFNIVNAIPEQRIISKMRYWDKAGTEGGGAYTAGVLMYKAKENQFYIADVERGQWSAGKREEKIKQSAEIDGKETKIWIEQEPGSGGKESAESTIRNLAGFIVRADKVTGSKEVRAEPYSVQVEAGNVYVLNKPWIKDFISEHESFPMGKFRDQVDAAGGAFNKLTALKTVRSL